MVRMGDALRLCRALHAKGSMTCRELAQDAGVDERYLDYRTTASGNAHNEK
jgi:hypothetical protein